MFKTDRKTMGILVLAGFAFFCLCPMSGAQEGGPENVSPPAITHPDSFEEYGVEVDSEIQEDLLVLNGETYRVTPKTRVLDGKGREIPIENLRTGDRVRIVYESAPNNEGFPNRDVPKILLEIRLIPRKPQELPPMRGGRRHGS